MAQTLSTDLRCKHDAIQKLNDVIGGKFEGDCSQWFSSACEQVSEVRESAIELRYQFSCVIKQLTTTEPEDKTTAEQDWPVAKEFDGWATDDCIDFCNSHGLIEDLRQCREAIKQIFSNIRTSCAELGSYYEIEEEEHVVFRLEISSDRATYKNEYNKWIDWAVNNMNDESRICFSISIDRV